MRSSDTHTINDFDSTIDLSGIPVDTSSPVSSGRKGNPGEDSPQDQSGPGMRIQVEGTLIARPSLIPDLFQVRTSGGEELPEEQLLELRVLRQLSQKRQHRLTCGP